MSQHTDQNDELKEFVSGVAAFLRTEGGKFLLKTVIVVVAILVIVPDFSQLKALETEKNKLIAIGFVQNPRVLWKMSEMEESEQKFNRAIRDMEIAMGLLEMHGANPAVVRVYQERLDSLISKSNEMDQPRP